MKREGDLHSTYSFQFLSRKPGLNIFRLFRFIPFVPYSLFALSSLPTIWNES